MQMFERYLILLGCTDDFCLIVIHFSVVHCSRTSELISLFLFLFQISSLRFIFLINQDLINVIRTESQKLVPTWHKEGDRQRHTDIYRDVRGMRRTEINRDVRRDETYGDKQIDRWRYMFTMYRESNQRCWWCRFLRSLSIPCTKGSKELLGDRDMGRGRKKHPRDLSWVPHSLGVS